MPYIQSFDQIGLDDVHLVGGKGLSLARMKRGGLPVPDGFCVTTKAFLHFHSVHLSREQSPGAEIVEAYQRLGGGLVAVRSSATEEDGQTVSFAGQQETILGVQGEADLLKAIARCWESLGGERALAYRRQQGVKDDDLAMAVVVQKLIPAEVAGVLFTRDPLDPEGKHMLIEASWGLGESVVSGRVHPDRFHLDRETSAITESHIAPKSVQITASGTEEVAPDKRDIPCLDGDQLRQLAELARQVEDHYGEARDVEWAFADGRFWLLQARPITTAGAFEREHARREEIARLRTLAEPGGTVWSKFNLAEILPEPTPMTWAIVRRFMSGKGGFGLMYRDLGFDPDPGLDEIGVFDLVAGRPYCNLSREPRLHYRQLPFEHPFAALKAKPARAMYPQPVINPARFGWTFWLKLPITLPVLMVKMIRAETRRQSMRQTFPGQFREEIVPAFVADVETAAREDLTALSSKELLNRLEQWVQRTLHDFARESLKPTALASLLMSSLEQKLSKDLGIAGAQDCIRRLTMGVHPSPECDLTAGVRALAEGSMSEADFIRRFGHRGPREMELAQPRWSEQGREEQRLVSFSTPHTQAEPVPWETLAAELKLSESRANGLKPEVEAMRTFLALREEAKHHLLKGYARIRAVLVELDRRHDLHGGVFFLTPDELPRLIQGADLSKTIEERRKHRRLLLTLEVPPVLFSDDLDAIGRSIIPEGGELLQGVPLSAGVAEGPALVLTTPRVESSPPEGYILVCPTTDPAWVPLFVGARGLIMETGGVLSHGAIVAREFGLPAVAGLAGATRQFRDGQRLRVDGSRGTVSLGE